MLPFVLNKLLRQNRKNQLTVLETCTKHAQKIRFLLSKFTYSIKQQIRTHLHVHLPYPSRKNIEVYTTQRNLRINAVFRKSQKSRSFKTLNILYIQSENFGSRILFILAYILQYNIHKIRNGAKQKINIQSDLFALFV